MASPTCNHLSASSIASFKACPQRYRLAYVEGLRAERDTDSQRMGTNWHAMHEVYAKEQSLDQVIEHLNNRYADIPTWIDAEAWALERRILLISFIGYLWYWQNDPIEVLASEVPYNLPLHYPRTGLPLPMTEVQRVGKIDHVIRWRDCVGVLERKSTSRSIAHDSDYWDRSKKDTQVSMYALAFRDMAVGECQVPFTWQAGERAGSTLYDVWHKPTIKPTTLTQKETAEFIQSGVYAGQTFNVSYAPPSTAVFVDGVEVQTEQGKKSFAIRETIEMFGARLLQDIYERPEFYYARREIARTDADVRQFQSELFAVYQAQRLFAKHGTWFSNEAQCRATFACQYIPICYGPGVDEVSDGVTTPAGFKRIFVDLTVNGKEIEE